MHTVTWDDLYKACRELRCSKPTLRLLEVSPAYFNDLMTSVNFYRGATGEYWKGIPVKSSASLAGSSMLLHMSDGTSRLLQETEDGT